MSMRAGFRAGFDEDSDVLHNPRVAPVETEAPNTASAQGSVVTLGAAGALRCSGLSATPADRQPNKGRRIEAAVSAEGSARDWLVKGGRDPPSVARKGTKFGSMHSPSWPSEKLDASGCRRSEWIAWGERHESGRTQDTWDTHMGDHRGARGSPDDAREHRRTGRARIRRCPCGPIVPRSDHGTDTIADRSGLPRRNLSAG